MSWERTNKTSPVHIGATTGNTQHLGAVACGVVTGVSRQPLFGTSLCTWNENMCQHKAHNCKTKTESFRVCM